jgi:pimeloyl-ACP methyl ester carboxylesterase
MNLIKTINATFDGPPFSPELKVVAYLEDATTQNVVLATIEDDKLVLTFRATKTKRNIILDLWAWPLLLYKGRKYHPGFLLSWLSLVDELAPAVLTPLHDMDIEIRGHSLGAAVAAIAALDLAEQGFKVKLVTLLACPKYATKLAIKALEASVPVKSYLNGNDYIWWASPFLHRPKTARIGKRVWWKLFSFKDHCIQDNAPCKGYETSLNTYNQSILP